MLPPASLQELGNRPKPLWKGGFNQPFTELSPHETVWEQREWAHGHSAGDSPQFSDIIIVSNATHSSAGPGFIGHISEEHSVDFVHSALEARASPGEENSEVNVAHPLPPPEATWQLGFLDTCWAWSYLAGGYSEQMAKRLTQGCCLNLQFYFLSDRFGFFFLKRLGATMGF